MAGLHSRSLGWAEPHLMGFGNWDTAELHIWSISLGRTIIGSSQIDISSLCRLGMNIILYQLDTNTDLDGGSLKIHSL